MTNKRNFTNATQNGIKTISDVWLTPQFIIDKIGISDLDPCGWTPNNTPFVKTANKYFVEEENGLIQDWNYETVFVNFPYSDAKLWMEKVISEYKKWNNNIIVLCFNRSDTRWFQNNVKYATGMNCLSKRISFLNYKGETQTNGNAPSVLIAFGKEAFKRIKKCDGLIWEKCLN